MTLHTDVFLRKPSPRFADASPHMRGIPDFERALNQHWDLHGALEQAGLRVHLLKNDDRLIDGSATDDTAIVTGKVAVFTRAGKSDPRAVEQQAIANLLASDRILKFISPPGILSSRDVVRIGQRFYIGLSDKTNQEGAAQLAFFLKEFGYEAFTVLPAEDRLGRTLHLKNCIVPLNNGKILIREELEHHYAFMEFKKILIPTHELAAGHGFYALETIFIPAGLPETVRVLARNGLRVSDVQISEFEKTGSTLASLILPVPHVSREKTAVVLPLKGKQSAAA